MKSAKAFSKLWTKKGRQAACHVMRLQLLIGLKNNAVAEILPGLSIADWAIMFQILQSKIANYPHWKHSRDIYDFVSCQPRHLTSNNLKGTTVPNHIRMLCKRWIDLFAIQTVDDHRNVEQPGDASLGGASGCNESCASGCCTAILEAFVCS